MLAKAMDADPDQIQHLERLGSENLHAIRSRVSRVLFDVHAPQFARISKLSGLIPDALVAALAQKIVPPLVAGRAAGALGLDHPERVKGVIARISPQYLADAAAYLDPRVIPVLAPMMSAEVLVPAAIELLRRGDYIIAAGFIENAPTDLIRDFACGIADNAGLLFTAAMTPAADRLNAILRAFPPDRLSEIIADAACGSDELLLAGISVLARLDEGLIARCGDMLLDAVGVEGFDRLARVVVAGGAVAELRVVAEFLAPVSRVRLLELIDGLTTTV